MYPEEEEYKNFLEELGKIFSESKKVKFGEGKYEGMSKNAKKKFAKSQEQKVYDLCTRKEEQMNKNTSKQHREFVNLQKSLVKNLNDLFTFVTEDGVDPTSNRAERGLRKTAMMRNNYQTSKTIAGAERRSVIASVLASLKQNLETFSLETILLEIDEWQLSGSSRFERQLAAIHD